MCPRRHVPFGVYSFRAILVRMDGHEKPLVPWPRRNSVFASRSTRKWTFQFDPWRFIALTVERSRHGAMLRRWTSVWTGDRNRRDNRNPSCRELHDLHTWRITRSHCLHEISLVSFPNGIIYSCRFAPSYLLSMDVLTLCQWCVSPRTQRSCVDRSRGLALLGPKDGGQERMFDSATSDRVEPSLSYATHCFQHNALGIALVLCVQLNELRAPLRVKRETLLIREVRSGEEYTFACAISIPQPAPHMFSNAFAILITSYSQVV